MEESLKKTKALANDPEGDFWIPEARTQLTFRKCLGCCGELKEADWSMFVVGKLFLKIVFERLSHVTVDFIDREILCIYIYMIQPPLVPPPPKGGIRHTYAAMYRYTYMFVLIYVCMPVCLSVCLLVCKYVRVPARSTCHCFCVCTQRYYMYT